jgi:hypothetical protein
MTEHRHGGPWRSQFFVGPSSSLPSSTLVKRALDPNGAAESAEDSTPTNSPSCQRCRSGPPAGRRVKPGGLTLYWAALWGLTGAK